jgi:hypothetical protein
VENSGIAQSSPFRTNVDISATSDVQQLRAEMEREKHTDSSDIRRLREEADAHANAYEPYDFTLHDVTEVTEPSRTQQSTLLPSSPPQLMEDSILGPRRQVSPLFGPATNELSLSVALKANWGKPEAEIGSELKTLVTSALNQEEKSMAKFATKPVQKLGERPVDISKAQPATVPTPGLFGRITSLVWSAPAAPLPHPALMRFDPLPNFEPFTKTHYKTLDKLYQMHKRKPTLFAPSQPPNANNDLLKSFPEYQKYVGANFRCWGYKMTFTDAHVVLCAAYMQLLTLKDMAEYEKKTGK